MKPTCVVSIVAVFAAAGAIAQQPRDDGRTPAGTALIAGRVVVRDIEARPLRKAIVALSSDDARVHRTAITDDAGAFSFEGLPKGRYELSATRRGWPHISYGAVRSHQPGTTVELADGERSTAITIRMPRGAVLTGGIVDQVGHPMAQTAVVALRLAYRNGERRLVRISEVMTDERGSYRLFGLAAGEYVVATTSGGPSALRGFDVIHPTGDVDVQRALASPGGLPRLGSDGAPVFSTVAYAPVYFPGTPFRGQAAAISVGAGEERGGLDFVVSPTPSLSLIGTVHTPRDVPRQGVTVTLRSTEDSTLRSDIDERQTLASRDGYFSFPRVPPGRYEVMARVTQSGSLVLWSETGVVVSGDHAPSLLMTLRPVFAISGQVRFDGDTPAPNASQIRIALQALSGGGRTEATIGATGDFTIAGLVPGRYTVVAQITGALHDAWGLTSAVIDGADVFDAPLEVRSGSAGAILTFGNRPAKLSGTILDAAGRPAPEQVVVVFSTNPRLWFAMSRRIRAAKPAADGRYAIENLPPGEYFVVPTRDVDDGEWYDSAWLQRFAGSTKIAIAAGEKLTRDFRVE